MEKALIDSGFQKELVIAAHEKIYSQCIKVNSQLTTRKDRGI